MPTVRRTSVSARTQGSGTAATGHQRGHQPGDGSATAGAGGPSLHADPAIPKHIAISYASCEHELVHETVVLIFSFSAFAMQILHLYRTVWWLPQSYTHFALKFYLVNPYLVGYVLTLLVPRWLWTVFKTFIHFLLPTSWQGHVKHHTRTLILISAGLAYAACATLITLEETVQQEGFSLEFSHLRYCYLFYPAFLAFVYHTDMGHYLDLIPDSTPQHVRPEREKVEVEHQCSSDPVKVRREVEHLRNDFNVRLQNVLLHSYNTALGCALFPCCFVQNTVHYDAAIAIQHIVLVWAGSLTINAVHAFPPKYCDTLHRAAKHLGCWDYVGSHEPANTGVASVDWCPKTVWKQGSIVRLENEIYRARGDFNSAAPGLAHHERFYALFTNAALLQVCLLVFQLTLVLLQFVLLLRSNEWYQMISLSLLQASGGYALFKLTRDSVVFWRLSLAEDMLKNA